MFSPFSNICIFLRWISNHNRIIFYISFNHSSCSYYTIFADLCPWQYNSTGTNKTMLSNSYRFECHIIKTLIARIPIKKDQS